MHGASVAETARPGGALERPGSSMSHNRPHDVGPPLDRTRALVVADHVPLADALCKTLGRDPFVARACRAVEAAAALAEWRPHLLVVDLDDRGDQLLTRLNAPGRVPDDASVIAATRRTDVATKLAAFQRGVDDVVCLPVAPEELAARAAAVVRRARGRAAAFAPRMRLGDLEIDLLRRRAWVGTRELHLTSVEQSLLTLLVANPGRLLSRDEILDQLWGDDYATDSNVVDRHVRNLRAKLQDDWRRPQYIATVPGLGYRFEAGDQNSADGGAAEPRRGAAPLVLTAEERAALERAAAAEGRVREWRRYRALLLAAEAGPEAAVRALGCARSSVYAWLAAWRRGGLGGVAERPRRGGRLPLLARGGLAVLSRLLAEDPRARDQGAAGWTVALLRRELARAGYPAGDQTVRRALHQLGWAWHRSTFVPRPSAAATPAQRTAARGPEPRRGDRGLATSGSIWGPADLAPGSRWPAEAPAVEGRSGGAA
jgi:DNA-binding response OmpR family regulator/transposase